MGIDDLFASYQKKIGTYDKQPWEKTIETRISSGSGLSNVQLRSTKLNNDLIDLDLIRGSSFTKAKPKHGFMTVAKQATLRLIFFPLYLKWWLRHTSQKLYPVIFLLYISQLFNILVYYFQLSSENVSAAEIFIPLVMMWVLSLIHSQIVATNPGLDTSKARSSKTKLYRRKRAANRNLHTDFSSAESTSNIKPKILRHHLRFDCVLKEDRSGESHCSRNDLEGGNDRNDSEHSDHHRNNEAPRRENNNIVIDDDGFESLNGNGSRSEEEAANVVVLPPVEKESELENKQLLNKQPYIEERKTNEERCDAWLKNIEDSEEVGNFDRERPLNTSRTSRYSADSETDGENDVQVKKKQSTSVRRNSRIPLINITPTADSTCDTEEEGENLSCPETGGSCHLSGEFTQSGGEYIGVTTNSEEDCTCTSDLDEVSDSYIESKHDHMVATAILTPPPSAKVGCTIWTGKELKKAELSVLDISSAIIAKVESMPGGRDYLYVGMIVSSFLALFPLICRIGSHMLAPATTDTTQFSMVDLLDAVIVKSSGSVWVLLEVAFGETLWERLVMTTVLIQRWTLTVIFFFLLTVAERTFKQRFLYAKLFSQLTSSQRARKSQLPHFRLNKVSNIKTWLSVRSYLKKRGPQRSVDVIVSAAFIITLLLLTFLCLELLKDTVALNSQYNLEALIWCVGLGALLLRFMTLGTKINKKYRNLSVLITEQINLHLQIERKPHKKEELTVANNVLKLAIDLLKELDSPFKISGLSANPILYNITKVIILSALSGILSEMLGFKLKLHKIKIK